MIPSAIVGRVAGESKATTSARRMMAYAAAIGADDSCYFDDLRAGGIVAPPAYCVGLEWPVVSGWWSTLGAFRSAEDAWGSVHVLQDSRFHALIKVGQTLSTTGVIATVRPTSKGAYVALKLETQDAQSHQPIVTSWWGGIFLGVSVDGPARSVEQPPSLEVQPATQGDPHKISIPIDRGYPHVYSECAQIWNPIHTERTAAQRNGMNDIILHGSATWALAADRLIREYANGDPARLHRIGGNFKAMIIPGTEMVLEHERDERAPGRIAFVVRNTEGELAFTHGVAEFD